MDCLMRLRLEYETTWQECLAQVQQCKVGVPGPRRPVRARGPLLPLLTRPEAFTGYGCSEALPSAGVLSPAWSHLCLGCGRHEWPPPGSLPHLTDEALHSLSARTSPLTLCHTARGVVRQRRSHPGGRAQSSQCRHCHRTRPSSSPCPPAGGSELTRRPRGDGAGFSGAQGNIL